MSLDFSAVLWRHVLCATNISNVRDHSAEVSACGLQFYFMTARAVRLASHSAAAGLLIAAYFGPRSVTMGATRRPAWARLRARSVESSRGLVWVRLGGGSGEARPSSSNCPR